MSATHETPINFPKIMTNYEKSMFVESTQGALGDTRGSPGMLWSDPESFGMMLADFWKMRIYIIFT